VKLISLNTWEGRIFPKLVDFLTRQSQSVDIFCFQEVFSSLSGRIRYGEVRPNLYQELVKILPQYQGIFSPISTELDPDGERVDFALQLGLSLFFKPSLLSLIDLKTPFLLGKKSQVIPAGEKTVWPVVTQIAKFKSNKSIFKIVNIHGISQPGHKLDTPSRLRQSKKLLKLIEKSPDPTILAGDFNLLPYTQSIGMFEENGFKNLIKDFKIEGTRSKLSRFYGTLDEQKFADYIFTKGIKVLDFKVLQNQVSDHLPLVLTFDI